MADAVEDRLRELYAITQIHGRLKSGDTLFEEARDRLEDSEERFAKALSAAYNRIYFPGLDETDGCEKLVSVTIDNGLKLGLKDQSAEAQIENLLASPRANYKLAMDFKDKFNEYFSMAEIELWPSGKGNNRTPWKDVISRAKNNATWPWMPGNAGMETLKAEALKQGRWRIGKDGYIEKGPFPKEKTSVNVSLLDSNPESGKSILRLTPLNSGDSPIIYYSTETDVSERDSPVENPERFVTGEGTLYFLVKDTTGRYESGKPIRWVADLKIRHQVEPSADKRTVTLQCTPKAKLKFTMNGSNPKDGKTYSSPFEIGPEGFLLLVYAKSGEATKQENFQIPPSDKPFEIDEFKPARLTKNPIRLNTTEQVYRVINLFREQTKTHFKGARIDIGEGEYTVTIHFQELEITAAMIEGTINSLREVLQENQSPVLITIKGGIHFENGFGLKEFVKIAGIELRGDEFTQDE